MKTVIMLNSHYVDDFHEVECFDCGGAPVTLAYERGFINSQGVFVNYQMPTKGEELVRRLKGVQIMTPITDNIAAQSIYLSDIGGLVRLRDALIKALPLEQLPLKAD